MSKRRKKGAPFVMLEKATIRSSEWRDLSFSARTIYIYIKANYKGWNNGKIQFKYSEATEDMSPATISRALKELEKKEWVSRTQYGGLFRHYNLYELTGKHDKIR